VYLGGSVASVPMTATVPVGSSVGDSFSVTVLFAPVSGASGTEGGTVDIAFGYRKTIDINVIEKPVVEGETPLEETAEANSNIWLWVIGIIIILIIIWWFVSGKKKGGEKPKVINGGKKGKKKK